jgi:beta-mannosidase
VVVVARPEPFKYIKFPSKEEVGLEVEPQSDERIRLSVKRPVKGVILDVEGDYVKFGDQAIDLVPGDPQTVGAPGLKGRKIQVRYLGDGSA